ncbi:hypothetical protein BD626DRAFT_519398 [Schizophyllum amplum]|uniref:Uncharacterized protein n=1 Tax=Schizophyllum amplum TaxID=97359 RepID=A0A550BVD4_9AGAR|nr:hypothetical protein BD626DRAFT_519398 [Auriculariopsis ampla]
MDLTPVHSTDTLGGDGWMVGDGETVGSDAETVAGGKATAPVDRSVTADTFITLPRTHFEFSGTVSALCGLVHSRLGVTGCQIVYSSASGVAERGCSANAPVVDADTLLDDAGAGAAGLPNAHGTPIVLFESAVQGRGIRELKLRTFRVVSVEAVESPHDRPGGSSRTKPRKSLTEVRETVWGTCPNYLAPLLRVLAPRVHRAHMEEYWKLFEDEEGA